MKKIRNLLCAFLLMVGMIAIASCGKKADYTIGILQLMTHDALDKATEGFKEEIEANLPEGKTVEFIIENPQNDNTSMVTMATQLVRKCDLVMGNATPAAAALKAAAATEGKTDLPILFTSVTDPVDAGLVTNVNAPEANITGTSDINPVSKQMDLIFDFDSTINKVGFLYTVSESNSKVQCDEAKNYLKTSKNMTDDQIFTQTVADQTGITAALNQLINDGCKAVYIPTDNTLASNMSAVSNVTNTKKVIVVCGEASMVDNGGTFSLSISYKELGITTGEMACGILFDGKTVAQTPVQSQTDVSKFEFVYNSDNLSVMGLTMSDTFKSTYNVK